MSYSTIKDESLVMETTDSMGWGTGIRTKHEVRKREGKIRRTGEDDRTLNQIDSVCSSEYINKKFNQQYGREDHDKIYNFFFSKDEVDFNIVSVPF